MTQLRLLHELENSDLRFKPEINQRSKQLADKRAYCLISEKDDVDAGSDKENGRRKGRSSVVERLLEDSKDLPRRRKTEAQRVLLEQVVSAWSLKLKKAVADGKAPSCSYSRWNVGSHPSSAKRARS